jgi:hypothetical protein
MTTKTSDRHYRLAPAFVARQFPRRYAYTIEECVAAGLVLTIAEATASLEGPKRRHLTRWHWSEDPSFELVAVRCGACRRRWRFVCPSCGLRSEHLYKKPGDDTATWSCRLCAGLTYSSKNHGPRHFSRRVPTPRQAVITKRRDELERRALDSLADLDPWWAQRRDDVLYAMTRAIAEREREATRAAVWLREQLRRPRRVAAASPEMMRALTPELLATLQRLNAVTP